jgi:hypothetical protein
MAEDQAIKHFQELVSSDLTIVDPTSIQIRANALVARLKALNRNANAATRTCKQATTEARHDMDQTHLGLQNLLYEKRHLEREIDKCLQFAFVVLYLSLQLSLTVRAVPFTKTCPCTPCQSSKLWHPPKHVQMTCCRTCTSLCSIA